MATRWHPDTCDCVLSYELAENGEDLICVDVEKTCDIHKVFEQPQAILDNCLELNRAWNKVQPQDG